MTDEAALASEAHLAKESQQLPPPPLYLYIFHLYILLCWNYWGFEVPPCSLLIGGDPQLSEEAGGELANQEAETW